MPKGHPISISFALSAFSMGYDPFPEAPDDGEGVSPAYSIPFEPVLGSAWHCPYHVHREIFSALSQIDRSGLSSRRRYDLPCNRPRGCRVF
jgi:hypothetical protein